MASRTLFGRKLELSLFPVLQIENRAGRRWSPDINRSVLEWTAQDRQHPFFLFVNYIDVHEPFTAPQPWRGKFSDIPKPGGFINWWFRGNKPTLTPEQLRHEVEAHDGSLAYLDDNLGKLMAELDRRGIGQNTIVMITADHGQPLGDHGYYLHGYALYMALMRVPLIIRYPGHLPAGAVVARPASITGIPATVLEMVGASPAPSFSAASLATLWRNPEAAREWPWPLAEKGRMFDGVRIRAIVGPRWHYMERENGENDLYDWEQDPQELNNLIKTPEGAATAQGLSAYLKRLLAEHGRTPPPADAAESGSSARP
jgi:arylsulfatase A-like enzyme